MDGEGTSMQVALNQGRSSKARKEVALGPGRKANVGESKGLLDSWPRASVLYFSMDTTEDLGRILSEEVI